MRTNLNSRHSEVGDFELDPDRRHAPFGLFFSFYTGQTKFTAQQKLFASWKVLDLPDHCFLFRSIHCCALQAGTP